MSLKEKINADLTAAMKSKDTIRLEALRAIRSEIIKMDKSGMNREMTEEEEIQLLMKQAKTRKESIEMFEDAGRNDLVEKEKGQLEVINEYLPAQMSREEAEKKIEEILAGIGEVTEKDFGRVMGSAMKELKGKIDGKVVQEIVKAKLEMSD